MVYRFTIISDEVDDFIREIQIDSEATFFEFHEAILKSAGYKDDQMTSFFLCDDGWEKEQEITLEDMGTSSDEDCYIMRETPLSELVEDEKQRLIYVFDPLTWTRQYAPARKAWRPNRPWTLTRCWLQAVPTSTWARTSMATRTSTWKTLTPTDSTWVVQNLSTHIVRIIKSLFI